MFSPRALSSGFIVVALALAAGCSGSAVEQPAASSTAAMTTGPLSVTVHGRAKAVADALATVPLRADQRTAIEQLATDTEAKNAPVRNAREQLILALADQIASGTIDRAALQPKIDAITAEWQKARPVDRAAFEKLHDLLAPEQRVALVNAMQANMNAHTGRGEHMMRMQKWVTDLGLTQDQQDQIRAKLADKWREHAVENATAATSGADTATMAGNQMQGMMHGRVMRERTDKMLEAFKGEKFSMDAAMPVQDMQGHAHEFSGRMLEMVETVLPILTPQQRTLAATKLRERAAHFED